MDPDANLARQREISQEIHEIRSQMTARWDEHEAGNLSIYDVDSGNTDDREGLSELGEELAFLAKTLDESLRGGGILPAAWQHPMTARLESWWHDLKDDERAQLGLTEDAVMSTADGVPIVDGLAVFDNNLDRAVVDLSSIDDGWFYVRYPGGGKNSMNAERVTTRHPFTGEQA